MANSPTHTTVDRDNLIMTKCEEIKTNLKQRFCCEIREEDFDREYFGEEECHYCGRGYHGYNYYSGWNYCDCEYCGPNRNNPLKFKMMIITFTLQKACHGLKARSNKFTITPSKHPFEGGKYKVLQSTDKLSTHTVVKARYKTGEAGPPQWSDHHKAMISIIPSEIRDFEDDGNVGGEGGGEGVSERGGERGVEKNDDIIGDLIYHNQVEIVARSKEKGSNMQILLLKSDLFDYEKNVVELTDFMSEFAPHRSTD